MEALRLHQPPKCRVPRQHLDRPSYQQRVADFQDPEKSPDFFVYNAVIDLVGLQRAASVKVTPSETAHLLA
ncbi:hypothetical protein PF003_g26148 [Phytophthora fragariae]|nr:hypothetical protein PF003_g26148 [Phytophthora fragariae]